LYHVEGGVEMRTVKLTAENWLFGTESGELALAAYDVEETGEDRCCCIGVALMDSGINKDDLRENSTLEEYVDAAVYDGTLTKAPDWLTHLSRPIMDRLYVANDKVSNLTHDTPNDRVERLNTILIEADAEFRFKYVEEK